MAQSSVAREPTMEEILASIRKIIESNEDPAGADETPPGRPQLASVDGEATEASARASTATRAETSAARSPAPAPVAGADAVKAGEPELAPAREAEKPSQRAISLADVAARLKRGEENPAASSAAPSNPAPSSPAPRPARESAPIAVADAGDGKDGAALAALNVANDRSYRAGSPDESFDGPVADRHDDFADRRDDLDAADETGIAKDEVGQPAAAAAEPTGPASREIANAQGAVPPSTQHPLEPAHGPTSDMRREPMRPADDRDAGVSPGANALMSTDAGSKVAAAFEDLSEAVARGQMRSYEEMAQEMLRPMLRDWLDDNLPTLVERLVREEIERVARGGRR